jgi:hypothetical protein
MVSTVGNTPSQMPAQYGVSTSTGVIGTQPTPCMTRTVLPIITIRTAVNSSPVTISIFR